MRLFDKVYHDVAKTERHINAFVKVLEVLFQKGGVFLNRQFDKNLRVSRLPAIGGYFGAVGVKPMFVTEHIEKMLGRRVVFNCGREQILLWGPLPKEDAQDISARMKFVTSHVIERVEAEMGHLKPFSCFDVETVREAFASDSEAGIKKQRHLERKLYRLTQEVGEDPRRAVYEYREVAPIVIDLTSHGRPLATASNVDVWEHFLEDGESLDLRSLDLMIRFYIAIEDGECQVERDLGVLAKIQRGPQERSERIARGSDATSN